MLRGHRPEQDEYVVRGLCDQARSARRKTASRWGTPARTLLPPCVLAEQLFILLHSAIATTAGDCRDEPDVPVNTGREEQQKRLARHEP